MRIAVCAPVSLLQLGRHLPDSHFRTEGLTSSIITDLILQLHQRGHDIHVATLSRDPQDVGRSAGERLTVEVGLYRERARERALDLFKSERAALTDSLTGANFDVVHAHWSYEFALAALAVDRDALVTLHDWAPAILRQHRDAYRTVRLLMSTLAVGKAHHLSAVSPYVQARAQRIRRRPVALVPNGIPFGREALSRPVRAGLLTIGALNTGFGKLKNTQTLLRAFADLRASHPSAQLRLAGEGYSEGGPAWSWAKDESLHHGVEFVGPIPHEAVPQFMRSLDIFAHPSLEESFGLVLLEAMRESVPVVAGERSGGVPWVLDSGAAGILTDVRSARCLAASLVNLARSSEQRIRLGTAGRDRARARFSIDAVAAQYEALYEVVVGAKQSKGRGATA